MLGHYLWIAYLIFIHLLALPGAYMALAISLTAFLSSTTNILTGETKPWARGMGWGLIGALAVAMLWGILSALSHAVGAEPSEHLALGNPSDAKSEVVSRDAGTAVVNGANLLLVKDEYCLSYNNSLGTPNWVAWRCSKQWQGRADRENDFRADDALPANWYHVTAKDYDATGFDRGHVCPSADRTKSAAHNSATFLMTNMMPQAPKLNRGTWKQLEDHCRKLALDGSELYIVAGPHGAGGTGKNGYKSKLASKKITVPSSCWKVVLVLPRDEDQDADIAAANAAAPERVSKKTLCYGAVMPNAQSIESGWENYQTTVREVEELTGYNFYSLVSRAVQDIIETREPE